MSWRVVAACEVGTSHAATNAPCQDSCWAQVDVLPDGEPLLSMVVADGAGSAARGGEGAEIAIQAAAAFLGECITAGALELSDSLATDLVMAVRRRIHDAAELEQLQPRDFACTLLGLLSSAQGSLAFQIGDGAIVLDAGAGLEVAVAPMAGEYANMTHFVTDEDAIEVLATKRYPGIAARAAVFSDGVQRLALNLAANTPHEPFFAPFFSGLARATAEQEDQLQGLLVKFLGSAAVNERTDDDKTLALAVRIS